MMTAGSRTRLGMIICCAGMAMANAGLAPAGMFTEGDHVMLQAGPYVYHRDHDTQHNNLPLLTGVEWESASRWELGAARFVNSFNQPCAYLYAGRRWFLKDTGQQGLYIKITGGPLYGYKKPYEEKIPLNHHGVGLAILPAIGYQYGRANTQLVFLGTAALMLTFGYDFWR